MYAYSEVLRDLEKKAAEGEVFFDTLVIPSGCGSFAVSITVSAGSRFTRISRLGSVETDGVNVLSILQEEVTIAALAEAMEIAIPESAVIPEAEQTTVTEVIGSQENGFKAVEDGSRVPTEIATKPATPAEDFMPKPVEGDSSEETVSGEAVKEEPAAAIAMLPNGHTVDDFMVNLGKYKTANAWFSDVLQKDKDTLRRLLRVPNPTSTDMKTFQEKARAYLEARALDINAA